MTTITLGSATELGRRENNEDSVLAVSAQDPTSASEAVQPMAGAGALLILADGMGGRAKGQLASQTAVKTVYRELAHILAMRSECDRAYLENSLHNALRHANTRILELGSGDAEASGMGTTCTCVLVTRGVVSVAHVGDSRAYIMPPESAIEMITEDHSVVAGEVRAGRLTEDEARRSKFRNVITRAVGVEPSISPDFVTRDLEPGVNHIILSSDGLHGSVSERRIDEIVSLAESPQVAAEALIHEALARGAKDNISVIVARVDFDTSDARNVPKEQHRHARRHTSRRPGNILAFLIGVVIAAASAWVALTQLTQIRFIPVPIISGHRPHQPSTAAPVDYAAVRYAAPQPLLGRTVMGSVMIPVAGDFLVVDPNAHRLLRVNPSTGQVSTSSPDSVHLESTNPSTTYWATDAAGELYESQTSPPLIRKFSPDGVFLRTIAQGVLTAPGAMGVAVNGDIYVIDAGTLERIRAIQTPPTSTSSAPPSQATAAKSAT